MVRPTKSDRIGRINGFLYGLSSLNGALRDHVNFPYGIKSDDPSRSTCDLINHDFKGQDVCAFPDAATVRLDRRILQTRIRPFLIRDDNIILSDSLADLRRYLSFRLMDMIEDVFGEGYRDLEVSEITSGDTPNTGDTTFFCLRSSSLLLVLQFNRRRVPIS